MSSSIPPVDAEPWADLESSAQTKKVLFPFPSEKRFVGDEGALVSISKTARIVHVSKGTRKSRSESDLISSSIPYPNYARDDTIYLMLEPHVC